MGAKKSKYSRLANEQRMIRADEIKLLNEILKWKRKSLPPDHPEIADLVNSIGSLYFENGKFENAAKLYTQSYQMRRKSLPPNHPDVAASLYNMGSAYYKLGKYDKSLMLFDQSSGVLKQSLSKLNVK